MHVNFKIRIALLWLVWNPATLTPIADVASLDTNKNADIIWPKYLDFAF